MSFVTLFAALAVSLALTPVARAIARRAEVLDVPNERSSHTVPTPRSGGYAIIGGVCVALVLSGLPDRSMIVLLCGAALIALVGAIDDVLNLREWQKLIIQIVAAVVVVTIGGAVINSVELGLVELHLSALGIPLTVFWIVGYTNAFNFMDGINGIASMQAVVVGIVLAVLFVAQGDSVGATFALAIAGGAAGFLPWNLPSGSIFMGDVGSATVGFALASLVARYSADGGSFVASLLPLIPFISDTSVTLARRILRGERFFSAHRSHFYQRLNQLGWSHSAVTGVWAVMMIVAGSAAILWDGMSGPVQFVVLAGILFAQAALFVVIDLGERVRQES